MKQTQNDLIQYLIELLYPFIILFGFYVILYGDSSPGGGFQGGAILAGVFILRYVAQPMKEVETEYLQKIEKIFYLLIILIPFLSIFTRSVPLTNFGIPGKMSLRIYLVLMNVLIGLKVCLGLVIIFYEFVLHERRWSK